MVAHPRNQRDPRFSDAGLSLSRVGQLQQCCKLAAQFGTHVAAALPGIKDDGIDQSAQYSGGFNLNCGIIERDLKLGNAQQVSVLYLAVGITTMPGRQSIHVGILRITRARFGRSSLNALSRRYTQRSMSQDQPWTHLSNSISGFRIK
jgi:hypothetical protein